MHVHALVRLPHGHRPHTGDTVIASFVAERSPPAQVRSQSWLPKAGRWSGLQVLAWPLTAGHMAARRRDCDGGLHLLSRWTSLPKGRSDKSFKNREVTVI